MKWFKHDTDCDESEVLNALLDQTGWAGYGRWFRILEIVASKMDKTEKCSATFPSKYWQRKLGFYHHKGLKDYLDIAARLLPISIECCTNVAPMLRESSGDLITISVPNLLKKRDEYSQKSGQRSDNVSPKNKEVRNKNKDKRIKKEDRGFTPPTLEEVRAYCLERNNSVNPERWHSHYSANGWKVGKNPMKDWKAAVRTWEESDKEKGAPKNGTGSGSNQQSASQPGKYAGRETVL